MSSNNVALRLEGLGKAYTITRNSGTQSTTVAEAVMQRVRNPLGKGNDSATETFWAVKNVSAEIYQGDVVGIIGRNGAGKSTLLKLLSRITQPTEGRATLYGRVGSLLEVGTGFHPELTGRENIFLNGAILGMEQREILSQFDAIVDFSGVERFLETPVKRYSSGMYVRLAFAVAAHLNPEILIVDEVLAVGDAEFQKKCMGKMNQVSREDGRTILFVSHNMGAISELCRTCILMKGGKLLEMGASEEVIRHYLDQGGDGNTDVHLPQDRNKNSSAIFTRCWIANNNSEPLTEVDVRYGFTIGVEVLVRQPINGVEVGFTLHNAMGQPVFMSTNNQATGLYTSFERGSHSFLITIPGHFLAPGRYSLSLGMGLPNIQAFDLHDHLLSFSVEETGSNMAIYQGRQYGDILVDFPWRHVSRALESDVRLREA